MLDNNNPLKLLEEKLKEDKLIVERLMIEHVSSKVDLVSQLAAYIVSNHGKMVRALLTLSMSRILGGTENFIAHKLATAVEFIHTATLLHDDVIDKSAIRRGRVTANHVWDNKSAILVGDFLFSRSFELMVESGSIDILGVLSKASSVIAQGEVLQLTVSGDLATSFETYLEVVGAKTATLFEAACCVGAKSSLNNDKDKQELASAFGFNLGIAFQIADDILDYDVSNKDLNKKFGNDFAEKKVTYPIILLMKKVDDKERNFLKKCFEQDNVSEGDFDKVVKLMIKYEILSQSYELARSYSDKSKEIITLLPQADISEDLFNLCDFVITRKE